MLIVRRIVQLLGFAVHSIYMRSGLVKISQTDALMTKLYMAYKNAFERTNVKAIALLVQENFTVLDVGAGFGFYSRVFSGLVPAGQVHSFEPGSLNFKRCLRTKEKMCEHNNVIVNQTALTSEKGFRKLRIDYVNPANNSIVDLDERVDVYEEVQTTTIDSYCKENEIAPNFIKIDIQGHEIHCLKGASEVLMSAPRLSLLIELDFINHKEKSLLVLDFLLGLNYKPFSYCQKSGFTLFDVSKSRKEYFDVFFFKTI